MNTSLSSYLLSSLLVLGVQNIAYSDDQKIPEAIKGSGCVSAGTTKGCLIVVDSKSNEEYNVYFSSKKTPSVGEAISFEGKHSDDMTKCMQGTPVEVTKWSKIVLACASSK